MIINVFVKEIKKYLNFLEKFTKKKCKKIKGFSMKSSCAPYNNCKGGDKKTKKKYLFNPNNPKKSFDVYVDKKKKQYQLADKYYSF